MLTWKEEWRSLRWKVVAVAASGSKNPDGKADHGLAGAVSTPSGNEVGGDSIMCEVEDQQAARVEVQGPKRKAVIRVESEETQDYVRKKMRMKTSVKERWRRLVLCRAP